MSGRRSLERGRRKQSPTLLSMTSSSAGRFVVRVAERTSHLYVYVLLVQHIVTGATDRSETSNFVAVAMQQALASKV